VSKTVPVTTSEEKVPIPKVGNDGNDVIRQSADDNQPAAAEGIAR
jgi:hypothetical protein